MPADHVCPSRHATPRHVTPHRHTELAPVHLTYPYRGCAGGLHGMCRGSTWDVQGVDHYAQPRIGISFQPHIFISPSPGEQLFYAYPSLSQSAYTHILTGLYFPHVSFHFIILAGGYIEIAFISYPVFSYEQLFHFIFMSSYLLSIHSKQG